MKTMLMLLLVSLFALRTQAGDPTAFALVKEGNRYVGEQSKDKFVQARSEKSIGGTAPQIWYIVYYDPTATLKAVEVKFGAGKMTDVKRPFRLLEPVTGQGKVFDSKRLNIDSDKAIKIALKEPLLAKLNVTATQLWLNHAGKLSSVEADENAPVWKVKLWAQKLRKPTDDADIGDVFISANDGKVLKSDLRINRVD